MGFYYVGSQLVDFVISHNALRVLETGKRCAG